MGSGTERNTRAARSPSRWETSSESRAAWPAVDLGGERTVFTKDQYTLRHTRWGWDADNGVLYPVESVVTAQNDARRLEMTIRALRTEPLRGDLPLPLRDLIIYEQTARYAGRLRERNAQGDWALAAVIKGDGFKEYTAKHY